MVCAPRLSPSSGGLAQGWRRAENLAEAQRFRTAGPGLVPEQAAARAQALSCEGPAVNARSPRYSRGRCGAREARRERGHGGRAGQRGPASHGWRRRGRGGGEQRRRRRSRPCGRLFGTTSASIDGRVAPTQVAAERPARPAALERPAPAQVAPVPVAEQVAACRAGGRRRFGPRRGWRWLRRQPSRRAQQRRRRRLRHDRRQRRLFDRAWWQQQQRCGRRRRVRPLGSPRAPRWAWPPPRAVCP